MSVWRIEVSVGAVRVFWFVRRIGECSRSGLSCAFYILSESSPSARNLVSLTLLSLLTHKELDIALHDAMKLPYWPPQLVLNSVLRHF